MILRRRVGGSGRGSGGMGVNIPALILGPTCPQTRSPLRPPSPPIAPTPIPPDATEEQLIALWLHGKSTNTVRAYRRDIAVFRAFIGKPIRLARSPHGWASRPSTSGPPSARPGRMIGSLSGSCTSARSSRSLSPSPSIRATMREAVTLQWRNLVDGVVNIRGKGGRTRVVRLSRGTWAELQALRPANALGDDRVFPMTAWNAWDRVRRAARAPLVWKRRSHRTSCGTRTGCTPCAVAQTSPRCARRSATHRFRPRGASCTPDLRNPAAIISPRERERRRGRSCQAGGITTPPAMMSKVIFAHPKREQTVEMSVAELEPYRERDDAPKQAPRRGRGR
jgi:hypothetical protein